MREEEHSHRILPVAVERSEALDQTKQMRTLLRIADPRRVLLDPRHVLVLAWKRSVLFKWRGGRTVWVGRRVCVAETLDRRGLRGRRGRGGGFLVIGVGSRRHEERREVEDG